MNGYFSSYESPSSGGFLLELVERLPIAAFMVDGDRLYCNRAAETLTGYPNSELATWQEWLGKVLEPVHGDVRELYEQDKAAGFPSSRDFLITCRDGSHRMVEFTATGSEHVFCVMHDVTARFRAEQKLKDSEIFLQEAQRIGNFGSYTYDMAQDTWTGSREFFRIFGIDNSFPKNFSSLLTLVHPESRSDVTQDFNAILATHRSFSMEYRIIRPSDGLERWVYSAGEFSVVATGITVMFGTIQDITERKETESKLVASEAKFRSLFDSTTDAIFILAMDGSFIDVNQAAYTRLGYTREELLAIPISQLDPPEFAARVPERLQRVREEGVFVFESAHRRKDGSIMPVEVNCRMHEIEGRQVYFSVIRDISDRKRAEQQLRESEERYRRFSNLTTDYVYSCSRRGDNSFRLQWMAGAVEEITGYSLEEILAMECWLQIVHPDDLQRFSRSMLLLTPGDRQSEEIRIVRKDGAIRWIRESCSCEQGETSDELVFFGTSRDITSKKEADADLNRLNEHLEQLVADRTVALEKSNEELASFCYAVSHELRAPIVRIQGFSGILGELCKGAGETEFMASRIANASTELQSVVDSILMLSRLSLVELSLQPVDLSEKVEQKLKQLLAENPERTVEANILPGVTAVADPGLMDICLNNLINNAFKYTGQSPDARIEFGLIDSAGEKVYFVRDNGAGFDMAYSEKLYAPFQRLHQHKEFPGIGVGLATVKRIINRHGGEVWAESGVGSGATFYFTLGGASR